MVNLMHSHGVFHHHLLAGRKILIKDFQGTCNSGW